MQFQHSKAQDISSIVFQDTQRIKDSFFGKFWRPQRSFDTCEGQDFEGSISNGLHQNLHFLSIN
jgi:hypothetical protein